MMTGAIIIIALLNAQVAKAYDFSSNGIYYNILSTTGTAQVTAANDNYNSYSGNVVIPAQVTNGDKTYKVSAIGDNAFRNCTGLASVTLGENVATIGSRAFLNCQLLTTINITAAVTTIGDYAFAQCSSLNTVTFNNEEPLELGTGAFLRCTSLTNVSWPSASSLEGHGGISILGTSAFAQCSNLETITLPGDIQLMGTSIFDGCSKLSSITLTRETPLTLKGDPFALADSQATIYVPSSGVEGATAALYTSAMVWRDYNIVELPYSFVDLNQLTYLKSSAGNVLLTGCLNNNKTTIDVRNTITDWSGNTFNVSGIAPSAFKNSRITTLNTANASRLKSIGAEAFAGCTQLTDVTLCEGINTMGEGAFAQCTALTTVQVPSTLRDIPAQAFADCSSLSNVVLVMGVATIGEDAFARCTSLNSINLPRSTTSVNNHAFRDATALQSITVHPQCSQYASCDGVLFERKYGEQFEQSEIGKMDKLVLYPMCKIEDSYYIPSGVTIISDNALEGAINLRHLGIPASTTTFGNECFKNTNIESINYRNTSPSNDNTQGITSSVKSKATLQVPVGTTSLYTSLSSWQGFKNIEECDFAYKDQKFGYEWNSNNNATIVYVRSGAVNQNGTLTIPATLSLDGYTYLITELRNNCTQNVAQSVKKLIINADSLSVIDTSNDKNPLAALINLENISLTPTNPYFKLVNGNLYNKLGNVFYYYLRSNSQQHFTLPNSVEIIMPQAFAANENLTQLTFNANAKQVNGRALEGCPALQRIDNANGITTIGYRAFAQCPNLMSFNGGERIKEVGREAFINCTSLVQFPLAHGMIKSLGSRAFKGCTSLKMATLGLNLDNLGNSVFEDCNQLEHVFFCKEMNAYGTQVFKGCTSLSDLWLCDAYPRYVDEQFFEHTANLYVPKGSTHRYSNISPWNLAASINACSYLNDGPDVNNDKVVNALDITLIMSVLLGDSDGGVIGQYDVNHDGTITAADMTVVYEYILNGVGSDIPYKFLKIDNSSIGSILKLGNDIRVIGINQTTHQNITSGLQGYIDNTSVATLTTGTTSSGVPYLEIHPVATGYCTLVAIVNDGSTSYYRVFPLIVTQ